jgi:hypothetical protein
LNPFPSTVFWYLYYALAGCPKLLAAETKLGYRKITFAVTWVYQNKNLSEELRIYYFTCPANEL